MRFAPKTDETMVDTKATFQETSQEEWSGKEENFEKFKHKHLFYGSVIHPSYEMIGRMMRGFANMALSLQWTLAACFAKTTSAFVLKRGNSANGGTRKEVAQAPQ